MQLDSYVISQRSQYLSLPLHPKVPCSSRKAYQTSGQMETPPFLPFHLRRLPSVGSSCKDAKEDETRRDETLKLMRCPREMRFFVAGFF